MSAATGNDGPVRGDDAVRVVSLYGDLLGTYGDGGNATVLVRRARARGFDADRIDVAAGDEVPDDGDIYVIGGGEDGPQSRAARLLNDSGALHRAIGRGAAVLAVCAGFQIMGASFAGSDEVAVPGLGLLDATSTRGQGSRIVGEVVVDTGTVTGSEPGLGRLTGYENHAGVTMLGPDAAPLGTVEVGTGNGVRGPRIEGARQGRVIGTYLHGPVLARNPALADLLLAWATGRTPDELEPLDDAPIERLRRVRFAHARQLAHVGADAGMVARLVARLRGRSDT